MEVREFLNNLWAETVELARFLSEEPYRYWVLGFVGLVVVLIVIRRIRRVRRPILLYKSQGGNVEIANSTLRGLIIGASERVMGVERATCSYGQRRRKLRIRLAIHLSGDAQLKRVEEELKRNIRRALEQHVAYNPGDVQPIDIRVTRIVGEARQPIEVQPVEDPLPIEVEAESARTGPSPEFTPEPDDAENEPDRWATDTDEIDPEKPDERA